MSEVAGEVDALLVPDIDVGNAIYKSFTLIGHAQVASILLGAAIPIPIHQDLINYKQLSIQFI